MIKTMLCLSAIYKIIKNNFNYKRVIFCTAVFCLTACTTLPTDESVPANLTPTEIKQRAQEEFDRGSKRNALAYYRILIKRYGSDISVKTAAEFEIAHILIKKKKWLDADEMLKEIIDRYEGTGGASITSKYYILAKNDYKITQEQIKKRNLVRKPNVDNEDALIETQEERGTENRNP